MLSRIVTILLLAVSTSPQRVQFTDITSAAGITFRHDNAATSEKYLVETMGSGAGWLDYDNDGYLDFYLAQGAATKAYTPTHALRGALYHNNGDNTFSDVTDKAGVGAAGLFAMGVAVGDYDNDGFPDLYVVGYGRSILYHNNGDGTFTDVTQKSGVANSGKWGSSAAWFDYDHDGKLDLVVANYVDWSDEHNIACVDHGQRAYCHPNKFHPQPPTLFHNNGNGTFSDTSLSSKMASKAGNGLGVVCFDANGDGWTDVLISNDSMENFLFINKRDGTFEEIGLEAGVAFGENGRPEAGMGVDAADYDNDGLIDVYITHLDLELNRLYHNIAAGNFEDATFRGKLGYQTFHMSGFGTKFIDYDNDGWRDLLIVNGHVLDNVAALHVETSYAEPKMMFRNIHGRFESVCERLGPDFLKPLVGRTAAIADFDNDGDLDILASNSGQEPQLLRNDGGNRNHWIEVRLQGTRSNRDGVGAVVKVSAGAMHWVDEVKGGGSYQSAHDPRLHFGLGDGSHVDSIEVKWPSGAVTKLTGLAGDRMLTIKEGFGEVPSHYPPITEKVRSKPANAL